MAEFKDFTPPQRLRSNMDISPDGKHVVYISNLDGQYNLYLAPTAGGAPRQLTHYTDNAVRQVAWSPDGANLLYTTDSHGDEQFQIHLLTLDGSEPRRLTTATDSQHVLGPDIFEPQQLRPFTPDGRAVIYAGNDRDPLIQDVLVHDLATDEVRRIESVDGVMLHGASVSPDGRWLLTAAARGAQAQERPDYSYSGLYQYLLSQGIAILAPNVRGSTGYGKRYEQRILRDFGGGDLGDFEHAVKYLHRLEWVDPTRITVWGASYGGFAALSCLSRLPALWAAGVSMVGMSNLLTLARSAPPTWRAVVLELLGDPDTDQEFLLSRSPITYTDAITAPLFVIQGANDPRVPRAESDQIVAALRERGVEVRYDVYENEGHGFTNRANEIKAIGDVAQFLLANLANLPRDAARV